MVGSEGEDPFQPRTRLWQSRTTTATVHERTGHNLFEVHRVASSKAVVAISPPMPQALSAAYLHLIFSDNTRVEGPFNRKTASGAIRLNEPRRGSRPQPAIA